MTPAEFVVNDPWWGTTWRSRQQFQAICSAVAYVPVAIR
jgi:hypothetical protein